MFTTRLPVEPPPPFHPEQRDAGRVRVVDQVVPEDRVLDAVAIDRGPAAESVVVDDVVLDQGVGNDAVAARADIPVHVDAAGAVPPARVPANDGIVAAVREIDPVLGYRARRDVVLDQDVLAEAGEDSPAPVLVARVVLNDDAGIERPNGFRRGRCR